MKLLRKLTEVILGLMQVNISRKYNNYMFLYVVFPHAWICKGIPMSVKFTISWYGRTLH